MRRQRVLRFLAPFAAVLLVVVEPAQADAQSLEQLKKQEDSAKSAADRAAADVTAAIGEWNRIHHEIQQTTAEIETRRARADELGDVALTRAVEAYKGSNFEVVEVFESNDLLEASRRARLLGHVTKRDTETISRLGVEASDLKEQEQKLERLLEEQQRILDAKRAAEAELERRFQQLQNRRKALEARLAAQEAARRSADRASRSGGSAPSPVGGLVCPFPGSSFVDSWGAPRSGGRRHKGVDMMGPMGAPLYAVTSGAVTQRTGGLAGKSVWLRGDDGNLYFYAHLNSYGASGRVNQGDVIGTNGNTGNARGGAPHLHLEVKLGGSVAINPYPTVRRIC